MTLKRIEVWGVVGLLLIALITSITTIIGLYIQSLEMIIISARGLSSSVILLLVRLMYYIWEENQQTQQQVEITLKSKEDVEEFKRQVDIQLQDYLKEIAEEEEKLDKDE